MPVSKEYIDNLVAQLNADKAERDAYIPEPIEIDGCDDELCMWCN